MWAQQAVRAAPAVRWTAVQYAASSSLLSCSPLRWPILPRALDCLSFRYTDRSGGYSTLPRVHSEARSFCSAREKRSQAQILSSSTTDIVYNLATECFLIDFYGGGSKPVSSSERPSQEGARPTEGLQAPVLFLWRNDRTIVIGRHQNAWTECDIQRMEQDGVTLARRYTGGGAVYQDLGNTCFTFLDPTHSHNKQRNNLIILKALEKKYGIHGVASGRNDLVTSQGLKFSGAAYSKLPCCWLHHGTVMREVDCGALARYLTPSKAKLESKGVKSVASRVGNLKDLNGDITHEGLCEAVIDSFLTEYGCGAGTVPLTSVEDLTVEGQPMREHPRFKKHLETLSDWHWRYGHSPPFERTITRRFDWGTCDVNFNVKQGSVTDIEIYSDCLLPDLVDALRDVLKGCRFNEQDITQAVLSAKLRNATFSDEMLGEFATWISSESQR